MFKRTKVCTGLMLAFGGTLALSATPALAQQTLQRVEITGSNIKRTDTETAAPVTVMTREDIERTGKQSIQEVLRGISADSVGSIPTSFTNGFASGSAAISLRGLGVNSTLVLINGRRMTTYGLADDGTRTFVDLNSLPLEAVERIEVLKDGASAIYGADAVGGVVNVILRKSYVGKAIGASYGQAQRGDGKTTRAFGSIGFGNLDADKYNFFFTLEASKQNNIWSKDRGFIGESDLRGKNFFDVTNGANRPYFGLGPTANSPFGVTRDPVTNARVNIVPCAASQIDPDTNLCRYNPRVEQEIQPRVDRINFFSRGTLAFTPSMTGYAEVGVFNTITRANGTLGGNSGGVIFSGDPFNPAIFPPLMDLPANHPDNPFPGTARTFGLAPNELGGRDEKNDNLVTRVIVGLQGNALGWDYDTAAGYIHSRLKNTRTGFINGPAMQAAVNNLTYRFAGLGPSQTPADVLAGISSPLVIEPTSSVALIDFKASRELMELPGGPLGIALGAEARREKANSPDVPGTSDGTIIGLGFAKFSASRNIAAVFGELSAPVAKILELNAALRYDHYSDFGNSTTPKLGFKLKPTDQFAVRGTYAEAFRAPGPAESGGSSFGFTTIAILSQGNPNIQPEKAKSYTIGLIAEPIPGTSATVDYWKIKRKNEIVQADPATIIPPGTPNSGGPISAQVPGAIPNSFLFYDANGDLQAVSAPFTNAASTRTDGIDVELRHRMNLGEVGKLTAQLNWTHTRKLQRTDAFGNTFEYAGTHGPIVQSSGSGTPKDRASLSLTLDRGSYSVTGMLNYVGTLRLVDHKGESAPCDNVNADGSCAAGTTVTDVPNAVTWNWDGTSGRDCGAFSLTGQPYNGCKLPSFTTLDLYARWSPMKNLDLNFSIQNVFDRKAPFDPYLVLPYGINYNQAWHQAGAVGRFFTVGAKYSF